MSDDTPEEQQSNELIALKSIYGESMVEVGDDEGGWSEEEEMEERIGWRPLHVALSLLPLHDSAGAHCSLTLIFKCCHDYPNKPPKISVRSVSGLSLENLNTLLKELGQLSATLCGEVMIYQLADHTQQFLHKHNRPTLSFYEQMVKEKIEVEEMRQRDLQVKQNEEAQQMQEQLLRRQETLQESPRGPPGDEDGADGALRLLCYEESQCGAWAAPGDVAESCAGGACTCPGGGMRTVRFAAANTKIYLGNCLGHSRRGSAHLALDERGVALLVRRWQLPAAPDVRCRELQLAALQRDVAALAALRCPTLEPYSALHVHTVRRQQLYAARRHLPGGSLRRYAGAARGLLVSELPQLVRLVRHVALPLFTALAALHEVGLLHRDVRAENIYLLQDGAVKLVGASVDARVLDLMQGGDSCDRHARAHDVARAGAALAALLGGGGASAPPGRLPADARDFFARCAAQDERSLWPAARLAAHPFLQPGPARAPAPPRPVAEEEEDSGQPGALGELGRLSNSESRLCAEFEVLSWIGHGGFGDVLKVRNKLDCGMYAIKRIKLNPQDVALNRKIAREVKLLSRLHHEHVVRYYNAWVEASGSAAVAGAGEGDAAPRPRPPVSVEWSLSSASRPPPARSDSDSDDDDDDDDDDEEEEEDDSSYPWTLRPEEESSGIVFQEEEGGGHSPRAACPPCRLHVLYIQMELCEKHTLRQAIDHGLHEDPVRAWRLFREVLEGLAHVHSKGMIHRDLKPANIFLDSNDHVKIGDFGLATKMFSKETAEGSASTQEEGDGGLTGEVGTALYAAPELRAGGAATRYNQKADVYSLGVTLFEMFHAPFATGAERAAVLARLRRPGVPLPPHFDIPDNAKQVYLLRWMLRAEPGERPSCAQLAASQHVPRAVPQGTLAALVAHALADRDAPPYARLVRACLEQRAQPADELLFHEAAAAPGHFARLARLADAVVEVFRSHCAEEVTPPLLTLCGDASEARADAVRLMTSSGAVCLLPYDLRLPFARMVARGGVQRLRRYAVGRVYRERAARGGHPREALHCAFDLVEPRTGCLWADAEALVCAARCAQALELREARVRLGHAALLRALLCCAGLPLEQTPPLVAALRDYALGRLARLQLQTHVATLALGPKRAALLMRLADADVPVRELPELIAQMQQERCGEALQRGVRELAEVEERARALGCELPVTVAPLLAYGADQHCGVFWQLVVGGRARRLRERHVLAAGGRYDELVLRAGRAARAAGRGAGAAPGAVGFSLSLERAAALCADTPGVQQQPCALPAFVCVCAGSGAALARDAWARGLRCTLWAEAEGARAASPAGLLLRPLAGAVRVELWDDTRVREQTLPAGDALELLERRQRPASALRGGGAGGGAGGGGGRGAAAAAGEPERGAPVVLVTFVTGDEKLNKNFKKQIENQVAASVCARLARAAGARRVCALALAADEARVAALAARLPGPPHDAPADACGDSARVLREAREELAALLRAGAARDEPPPLLALYSIPDGACRLLL